MVQKDPNIELCCSSSRKPPFCLAFFLIMRQIIFLKGRVKKYHISDSYRPIPWETCREKYVIRTGSFVHHLPPAEFQFQRSRAGTNCVGIVHFVHMLNEYV